MEDRDRNYVGNNEEFLGRTFGIYGKSSHISRVIGMDLDVPEMSGDFWETI